MSALFHPYLCGRNAAEWLITMKLKKAGRHLPSDRLNTNLQVHSSSKVAASAMLYFVLSFSEIRQNPNPSPSETTFGFFAFSTPEGIRTSDLLIRSRWELAQSAQIVLQNDGYELKGRGFSAFLCSVCLHCPLAKSSSC